MSEPAPGLPTTAPSEYEDEATFVLAVLRERAEGVVVDALELGCGGGNLASHLKRDLRLTLTDVSPDMLGVSRALNPECDHVEGDMRALRLGREFDAVVLHDAVVYMTSEADLPAAMKTARLLGEAGLEVGEQAVVHDPWGRDVFVGVRPIKVAV